VPQLTNESGHITAPEPIWASGKIRIFGDKWQKCLQAMPCCRLSPCQNIERNSNYM